MYVLQGHNHVTAASIKLLSEAIREKKINKRNARTFFLLALAKPTQ